MIDVIELLHMSKVDGLGVNLLCRVGLDYVLKTDGVLLIAFREFTLSWELNLSKADFMKQGPQNSLLFLRC